MARVENVFFVVEHLLQNRRTICVWVGVCSVLFSVELLSSFYIVDREINLLGLIEWKSETGGVHIVCRCFEGGVMVEWEHIILVSTCFR